MNGDLVAAGASAGAGRAPAGGFRSHAFGVDLRSSFTAPGLPHGSPPHALPQTRLELVTAEEIEAAWQPRAPERLLEEAFGKGRAARTIDRDEELGYRLYAPHFGLALISPSGDRVLCAPPTVAAWRWQRFLVGRVLPWAALLRGREVFHASAVRIGDRAIAVIAASGGGKTSLAVQLILQGAGFITDDVLAVDRRDEQIRAHPGASIVALRPEEKAAIGRSGLRQLGRVLGTSGKTYVAVPREDAPAPLGALYFVSRSPRHTTIDAGVDAKELLASTFIVSVATPQRLAGLLDLCSELARRVPIFHLRVGVETSSREVAAELWEHASRIPETATR